MFNSIDFCKKEKLTLNVFPRAKAKQLNHHATIVLAQHQYDSAIIHVGINNLLNGSSIEQISKDVIEIAQWWRNRSIGFCFWYCLLYQSETRNDPRSK